MSHNSNTIILLRQLGNVSFCLLIVVLANNFMQLILDQVQLLTIYYFGIVAETTQVTSDIFTGIEVNYTKPRFSNGKPTSRNC
jgi:hypothetical protein